MKNGQTNPVRAEGAQKKSPHDFSFDMCMKASSDLREVLRIDDEQYMRSHYSTSPYPRKYYIYGALNEVEKAGTAILRAREFIGDGKGEANSDRVSRNIITAVLEEQTLWIRKLTEILTELILFAGINEDVYYRHYMLVKGLKSLKATIVSEEMAYGCVTQNYQQQADDAAIKIAELETSDVDRDKCWYLKETGKSGRIPGQKAKLSGLDERINLALTIATQSQVIALGLSPEEGYGNYSIAAHFNPITTREQDVSLDGVSAAINHIGLLAGHIIAQARMLLGDVRTVGYAAYISEGMSDNDEVRALLLQRIKPEIGVGDFVNAQGDLAEVVEIKTGGHSFRSFRVRFLLNEDTEVAGSGEHTTVWTHQNPEFEEYPAMWVAKMYDRQQILANMRKEILNRDPKADLRDEVLNLFLNDAVIHLWKNVGIRETVHGNPSEALEKIKKEIERTEREERVKVV